MYSTTILILFVIFFFSIWYMCTWGPVDVVFTYYSPILETEVEREEKNKWKHVEGKEDFISEQEYIVRFTDCMELKYALRSVRTYLPWIRKIFIVISNTQKLPPWMKTESELSKNNIYIIRHAEIFYPSQVQPCYNSQSIESVLHRIPGLAEKFIYFNDDTFAIRNISQKFFFTNTRKSIVHFTDKTIFDPILDLEGTQYQHIRGKTHLELQKRLKKQYSCYGLWHQAKGFTKTQFINAERLVPDLFASTRSVHFRNRLKTYDILILVSYIAIFQEEAIPSYHNHHRAIYYSLDSDNKLLDKRKALIEKIKKNKTAALFCLNNSTPEDVDYVQDVCSLFVPNKIPDMEI